MAVNQRWTKPLDVEPGHWKKQLPQKRLKVAAKDDVEGLRALLAANPLDLNRRGLHGRTLLWEAVRAGKEARYVACRTRHLEVIALLLERGGDPSVKDDAGRTPLDIAHAAKNEDAINLLVGR